MKKVTSLYTCFIALFITQKTLAQTTGKIESKVVDSATSLPITYASVTVFKVGDSTAIRGTLSDDKGFFSVGPLPFASYRLVVSNLGYNTKEVSPVVVNAQTPATTLSPIALSPKTTGLSAVMISAKAPTITNKIDKLIYDPSKDISSSGGMAVDLLRKTPMVSVDADGNTALQGDRKIRFLINGKPSGIFAGNVADALQGIAASQVKRIEVMTNPGAKYDAEGTAGIINIVLKDNTMQGVNGAVNLSVGTRLENGGFTFNVRKGKLGLNTYLNGNGQLRSSTLNNFKRSAYNMTKDTLTNTSQQGNSVLSRLGYQAGLSVDLQLSARDLFIGGFSYNHAEKRTSGSMLQEQRVVAGIGQLISDDRLTRSSLSTYSANTIDWSLGYKRTFKREGESLNAGFSYSDATSNTNNSQMSEGFTGSRQTAGTRSSSPGYDRQWLLSIDYTRPINKNITLEAGGKTIVEQFANTAQTDTLLSTGIYHQDASQHNSFSLRRTIYAGYVAGTFNLFADFLNVQTGIRYERTLTQAQFAVAPSGIWAPSFVARHYLDPTSSLKLTYAYRIARPSFEDLNPFYDISDPSNITTGNPQLRTEIGQRIELGYSKTFGQIADFYIGAYYYTVENNQQNLMYFYPVYQIGDIVYYNVSLNKVETIPLQTTWGFTLYGSVHPFERLSLRGDAALRQIKNVAADGSSLAGLTYKVNLNADYNFGWGLTGEAFFSYTSRRAVYQSIRPAFLFYTLAVKKQLWDKKLSVGIVASNLFTPYVRQLANSYADNFEQSSLKSMPLRSIGVTMAYKFGRLKQKDTGKPNNDLLLPVNSGD